MPDLGSTERGLVADVATAPDDDAPRLVYADWLGDRGDPRGELIVVQCALDRADRDDGPASETTTLRDRSFELMNSHREAWLAPVLDVAVGNYRFHRGFIERLEVLAPDIDCVGLHEVAPLLRAIKTPELTAADLTRYTTAIPLDELTVYGVTDSLIVRKVFEEPRLASLRRLHVSYRNGRPHLSELARLEIPLHRLALHFHRTDPFTEPGLLESVVAHPARSALRSLDLAWSSLGELDAIERLPDLEALTVAACSYDLKQLRTLKLPNLTSLAITNREGGMEALDLAELLTTFPALRRLRLSNGRLGDRAALSLAACAQAARLRRLDLSHNQIGTVGARAFADSEHLRNLVWLDLSGNPGIADVGHRLRASLVNADVRM